MSVSRNSPSELRSEIPESLKISSELIVFSNFAFGSIWILWALLKHFSQLSDKVFFASRKSFRAHRLGLMRVSMPVNGLIRIL